MPQAPAWSETLQQQLDRDLPELIAIRHDLHAHPQLRYEETYAASVVKRELTRLDVPHVSELAQTGVVGWIMPEEAQAAQRPALALRADMDALPITEATGLPYAAGKDYHGCMHACGHDGHTTILLGAVRMLATLRRELPRPIKLIFQPAEESGGGAAKMIQAGALDERTGDCRADRVVGLHNWPRLPLGACAIGDGPVLAGTDLFTIDLDGRGGHAAMPHLTRDPILAGAQIITALQSVVSRNLPPTDAAVLSVTRFHAGEASNIIPDQARLAGTMRYFTPQGRTLLHSRLREVSEQIAAALCCRARITVDEGYPPTVNDPALADHVRQVARQMGLRHDATILPVTVAEDFSYYGQQTPATFILLGAGRHDQAPDDIADLHTARYDFNDNLLPTAIRLFTDLALTAASA